MDFYNAKAKEMAIADVGQKGFKLNITKKDVSNGFLAYSYSPALGYMVGVLDSPEEMAYFVAKNGKKLVVTSTLSKNNFTGSITWSGELPKFYELKNGTLTDKTDSYLPSQESSKMMGELNNEEHSIYIKLPQTGTTILVGSIDRKTGTSSFKPVYELQFDVNNGTFKVVKK